jgi:hypothetical protein
MFTLACAQADATFRGVPLYTGCCDIPAAFINGTTLPRSATGGVQLYTRLHRLFPPPYSNALAIIQGPQYGLRQANSIYDKDLHALLISNGFTSCPSHPHILTQRDANNEFLFVCVYVDDFDYYGTSPTLISNFKTMLLQRYGPMTFHEPSIGLCSQVQVLNPDKSITLHYAPYLTRVMARVGMDLVPGALSPDVAGLFDPSTDPTPLSPSATKEFRTVNGELIQIFPGRHDVKRVAGHLLTRGQTPDNSDYLKQLHLLRYLKSSLSRPHLLV